MTDPQKWVRRLKFAQAEIEAMMAEMANKYERELPLNGRSRIIPRSTHHINDVSKWRE